MHVNSLWNNKYMLDKIIDVSVSCNSTKLKR